MLNISRLQRHNGQLDTATERTRTVTQFGTKSHLLITSTTCLCAFSLFKYSNTDSHMVPKGSRASKRCSITSEESMTL